MFIQIFINSLVDRAHSCSSSRGAGRTSPCLQVLQIFLVKVSTTHVLISTAITAFTSGDSVALSSEIISEVGVIWPHWTSEARVWHGRGLICVTWFVEVLSGIIGRTERRSVEIVKHQIHVLSLLVLQVVTNLDITVNLDLDVGIGLAGKGAWFRETTLMHHLILVRTSLPFSSRTVPDDSLDLARTRVLLLLLLLLLTSAGPCEVMISVGNSPACVSLVGRV